MTHFYDPKDQADLERVERILKQGSIQYSLSMEPEVGLAPYQINVAEEDIPWAEQLLFKLTTH